MLVWLGYPPGPIPGLSSYLYHLLSCRSDLTLIGIPTYRTLVQYVPQRPSLLPGTPLDFLHTIRSFRSRQARARSTRPSASDSHASEGDYGAVRGSESIDPLELAAEWGIEKTMWKREWGTLSGGEGQRIALAVAVGVGGAEVVLLDGGSTVSLSNA
jgi:ABC-type iron transport system FetAB ATPase subunit